MEEFFQQGDLEKQRQITVSAMMDRTTANIPKVQIGFCDFVVKPLVETLSQSLPGVVVLRGNIVENIKLWKAKVEAN